MKILLILVVFFALLVPPAQAAPVLVSFSSGDGSAISSTGNTFLVTPHPLWGSIPGAQWVSAFDNTGYGEGYTLPNSDGVTPSYTFTQTFILPHEVNTGSGTFGADDTMGVWMNGNLVKAPNFVGDGACAGPDPIGCESGEMLMATLTPYLVQGLNTLEMRVFQMGFDVTGATWSAEFTSTVPEPSTYATMGGALLGIATLIHRRRKQKQRG